MRGSESTSSPIRIIYDNLWDRLAFIYDVDVANANVDANLIRRLRLWKGLLITQHEFLLFMVVCFSLVAFT